MDRKGVARPAGFDPATLGLVTMERPAPIRSSWVTLRVGALHNAEPHAKGAGHEEGTVCRSRCARGHDRGRRGGAGRDGALTGSDSESTRIDPQAGEAAGIARARARLLRGGPHRVCHLLAADRARRAVRGGRTHLGAGEGRRSREDGSARCAEAGAELPRGRRDAGVGPRRRA